MSDYKVTDSELTGIANAIRVKGGTSSPLVFPNGFTSAIEAIPTGSGIIEPLSITQNGTYTPPSGVDGYAPVTVNVSGGSENYLPYSDSTKILLSEKTGLLDVSNLQSVLINTKFLVPLSAANTDVTCYCVPKYIGNAGEVCFMSVPFANTAGNVPCFYCSSNSRNVECTVYEGNTVIPNITIDTPHIFALSINASEKKVRYYYDGIYFMEKTFTNSGAYVGFGRAVNGYDGKYINFIYTGVVDELESNETIIANMQNIMSEFGIGA